MPAMSRNCLLLKNSYYYYCLMLYQTFDNPYVHYPKYFCVLDITCLTNQNIKTF